MNEQQRQLFCETVWEHYRDHGRHTMPWRQPETDGSFDAYKIMVSETMLQQTQVSRVVPKFAQFLMTFPTIRDLAAASLGDVLRVWTGLGYNRRAKFLWQAAQTVTQQYNGVLPAVRTQLQQLPGVGPNTAGAILVYAYNLPEVFIETNIRTVFIHHFFADKSEVNDKELVPLIAETLDREQSREWYWALMDYGTYLKQTVGNVSRASKSYARQSTFHGSKRQIRGQVIRLLAERPHTRAELVEYASDARLDSVLSDLVREGMIVLAKNGYRLAGHDTIDARE